MEARGRARRRLIAAFVACALGCTLLVGVVTANAAQKAREYVLLDKLCVFELNAKGQLKARKPTAKEKISPIFLITNLTNKDLPVLVTDRYIRSGLSSDWMVIPAGQTIQWHAPADWPWQSTYKPDKQYFAHFDIDLNGDGDTDDKDEKKKVHEFCDCNQLPPSSTTTTTVKPTTTTTTKPTTTTTSSTTTTSTTTTSTTTTTTSTTSTTTTTTVPNSTTTTTFRT